MTQRTAEGRYGLDELSGYSAVCGTGLELKYIERYLRPSMTGPLRLKYYGGTYNAKPI